MAVLAAASSVGELVVSSIAAEVARHSDYLLHFKAKTEELVKQLGDLTAVKEEVEVRIDQRRARRDVTYRAAERWVEKVQHIQTEVTLLVEKSHKIDRWFKGWFGARHSLGKKAVKITEMVVVLRREKRDMDDMSDPWLGPRPEDLKPSPELLKMNLVGMESGSEELTAAINDVQEKVDAALRNKQLIRSTFQTWLTRAADVQAKATQLKDKAAAYNSSSSWISLYVIKIRKILTEVDDVVGVIDKLVHESNSIFSDDPYFEEYRVYIDFPSRKATAERVMVALKNDEIRLVGLYGMPGVGKTMLIQALSQQAKDELLFDEVVMVSLSSQNQDLRTIQNSVAMQLDLMLEENESDISRAEQISQRLLQYTNVLVVLDNLCERAELAKVGIPLRNTTTNERCCCCKVVFTTRDQNVCDEMETDEKIQVVVLSGEDSSSLFLQNAGLEGASLSAFQPVVKDLLNECKGLPLAIVTLGITLRHLRKVEWVDALVQLEGWIHAGMGSITSSVRLSFQRLLGEYVKHVFLCCCLFPKDFKIEIEVLQWYLYSLGEDRSKLDDAIGYLVSSPLLLYDKEDLKHVRMNDAVRDAAISIASDHRYIVQDGTAVIQYEDIEYMLLTRTEVRCGLPNQIIAPNLLILSLNSYNDLNEIPPDFFMKMPNLRVLDISNTDIDSLPRSLPYLVRLRTLFLKNCRKLIDVSLIEKLKNLKILDLSGSNIQRLPKVRTANLKWYHV